MRKYIAGVDIGNATTETALGLIEDNKLIKCVSGINATTGIKGTNDNIKGIIKSLKDAAKKMVSVARDANNSITHDFIGKFGSASVLLKRAPEGTGIIAGGPARNVLELAGYKNIRTKSLGSNNKQNVVFATIAGLMALKTPEEVARNRGKSVEEITN